MRMIVMFEDFNGMLTVEELCYMLRIGRNKAYDLLRSGRINAFRDGKLWMIPKEAVINYIRKNSNHNSTR